MRALITALFLLFPAIAAADTYAGCTKAEAETIARSMADAKRLAVNAAAAVGDTPEFEKWFGKYSPALAEQARRNLKNIVGAIRSGAVTTTCQEVSRVGCEPGFFAYVYADEPYRVHICPPFFGMPNMARLRPGQLESNFGTRAGTLIHEISHFSNVAATEDNCYARDVCSAMAQLDPNSAIENADSYQYFAEDVTYFRTDPVVAKPAPAAAGTE